MITYGESFFRFVNRRQIGHFIDTADNSEFYLTIDEVNALIAEGLIRDGRTGGLVIGNFHIDGGIHILQPSGDKFKYTGEMEGYEYLVNEFASKKYIDRLASINEETKTDHTKPPRPFDIPNEIRIIDARHPEIEVLILSWAGHYIINRAASEKNLMLLDTLNKEK